MSNEREARDLAARLRDRLELGDAPIKDLFELAHAAKAIDVLSMDADESEHGLSMYDPRTGTYVIAVATTTSPVRQRSSIAHELGHVLAGDLAGTKDLVPGERSPEEIRADAFARHLLLPLRAVRHRLGEAQSGATIELLSDLVQEFGVSPNVAAIQLREVGAIDAATCDLWRGVPTARLATQFGWLSQYRALAAESTLPRAPQGLMRRAVDGFRRGLVGIAELALWYQQPVELLESELSEPARVHPHDIAGSGDDWDEDAPLFPGGQGEPTP